MSSGLSCMPITTLMIGPIIRSLLTILTGWRSLEPLHMILRNWCGLLHSFYALLETANFVAGDGEFNSTVWHTIYEKNILFSSNRPSAKWRIRPGSWMNPPIRTQSPSRLATPAAQSWRQRRTHLPQWRGNSFFQRRYRDIKRSLRMAPTAPAWPETLNPIWGPAGNLIPLVGRVLLLLAGANRQNHKRLRIWTKRFRPPVLAHQRAGKGQ